MRRLRWLGGLAFCASLSGCADRSVDGGTVVFTWPPSVGLLTILAGLACFWAAWLLREKRLEVSIGLVIVGLLVLVFFAPARFMDRVIINDEAVETRYGIWFSPTVLRFHYAGVESLHHEVRVTYVKRKRRKEVVVVFVRSDGGRSTFEPGWLSRHAVPEILDRARSLRLKVVENVY
jgi:hypothetical protein